MNKKIYRTTLAVALILALIGLTVSTFAMWDRLTVTEDNTIEIGAGTKLTRQVIVSSNEGRLIPKTAVLGPGDIHEVVFKYELKLNKQTVEDLLLSVNITNICVGGVATFSHLVETQIFGIVNDVETEVSEFKVNNTGTTVILRVSLLEPDNQDIYEAIKNKFITFDVEFAAYRYN